MGDRKVVMLSKQTYGKLNAIKLKIEKIVEKPLSFDQVINILLVAKSIDTQLVDLELER